MLKYAKITNNETKRCMIGLGDPDAIYEIKTVQEEDGFYEYTEEVEVIVQEGKEAVIDDEGNIIEPAVEEVKEIQEVVRKEPKYKDVEQTIYVKDFWEQECGMTEQEVEQAYTGEWYLLGYAPVKPAPTKQEVSEKRRQLYIEQKDPLTCQIQALRDEPQTDEIIAEIEALKIERAEVVAKIKEENPYPVEPTETKASEVVDDSQMEQLELPLYV